MAAAAGPSAAALRRIDLQSRILRSCRLIGLGTGPRALRRCRVLRVLRERLAHRQKQPQRHT